MKRATIYQNHNHIIRQEWEDVHHCRPMDIYHPLLYCRSSTYLSWNSLSLTGVLYTVCLTPMALPAKYYSVLWSLMCLSAVICGGEHKLYLLFTLRVTHFSADLNTSILIPFWNWQATLPVVFCVIGLIWFAIIGKSNNERNVHWPPECYLLCKLELDALLVHNSYSYVEGHIK